MWHDELLCNLLEGRMVGKPARAGRRLQMLEDLYENNRYEVLKRTIEDRSERKENTRKKLAESAVQLKKN